MSTPTIGLTGVTGHIGGEVARSVADLRAVLLARTPSKAPSLPGCEVRKAAYDADAIGALRGIDVLFMVSATETPERRDQHRAFVQAAADAGVQHIVYTSFDQAGPEATSRSPGITVTPRMRSARAGWSTPSSVTTSTWICCRPLPTTTG